MAVGRPFVLRITGLCPLFPCLFFSPFPPFPRFLYPLVPPFAPRAWPGWPQSSERGGEPARWKTASKCGAPGDPPGWGGWPPRSAAACEARPCLRSGRPQGRRARPATRLLACVPRASQAPVRWACSAVARRCPRPTRAAVQRRRHRPRRRHHHGGFAKRAQWRERRHGETRPRRRGGPSPSAPSSSAVWRRRWPRLPPVPSWPFSSWASCRCRARRLPHRRRGPLRGA